MKTKNNISIYQKPQNTIIRLFLCLMLFSVCPLFCREAATGCINIECDADGVPVYVNGIYSGNSPVKIQCNLNPEEYIITFFPPLADNKIRYLDKETYIDILNRSSKSCFVMPGDTVTVFMQWQPIMLELAHLEKEHRRTQWTLMAVAGLIIVGFISVWVTL